MILAPAIDPRVYALNAGLSLQRNVRIWDTRILTRYVVQPPLSGSQNDARPVPVAVRFPQPRHDRRRTTIDVSGKSLLP